MKKYYVEVNKTPYEVLIKEVTNEVSETKQTNTMHATTLPTKDVENIISPMPGSIFKINIKNGQTVKAGDVLFVLEAMKMENEIMAPKDGTVTNINVQEGTSVESGTILCSIS